MSSLDVGALETTPLDGDAALYAQIPLPPASLRKLLHCAAAPTCGEERSYGSFVPIVNDTNLCAPQALRLEVIQLKAEA
jgi:hypothetical protein